MDLEGYLLVRPRHMSRCQLCCEADCPLPRAGMSWLSGRCGCVASLPDVNMYVMACHAPLVRPEATEARVLQVASVGGIFWPRPRGLTVSIWTAAQARQADNVE